MLCSFKKLTDNKLNDLRSRLVIMKENNTLAIVRFRRTNI